MAEVDNRPTDQRELEKFYARERGEEVARDPGEARNFQVEGNDTSNYVGVSPEYMNYANETEKPLAATEGVAQEAEQRALDTDNPALLLGQDVEQQAAESEQSEQEVVPPATPGDDENAGSAKKSGSKSS